MCFTVLYTIKGISKLYLGGVSWDAEGVAELQEACQNTSRNFSGKSIVCVPYGGSVRVQSPMPMCSTGAALATSDLIVRDIKEFARAQIGTAAANQNLQQDLAQVCDALKMHAEYADIKDAAAGAISGETTTCRIMYGERPRGITIPTTSSMPPAQWAAGTTAGMLWGWLRCATGPSASHTHIHSITCRLNTAVYI